MDWARLEVVESVCRKCPKFVIFHNGKVSYDEIMPGFIIRSWSEPVTLLCGKTDLPLDVQKGDCAIDICKTTVSYMKEFHKKGCVCNSNKYLKRELPKDGIAQVEM